MFSRWIKRYNNELFTFSVTVGTDGLHLLNHPGTQLSHCDLQTPPVTGPALLHGSRFTSSPTASTEQVTQRIQRQLNRSLKEYNINWMGHSKNTTSTEQVTWRIHHQLNGSLEEYNINWTGHLKNTTSTERVTQRIDYRYLLNKRHF